MSEHAPAFTDRLGSWPERLERLVARLDPESCEAEAELEALEWELRASWLAYARGLVDREPKSLPVGDPFHLPSGVAEPWAYDRVHVAKHLEGRARAYRPPPPGWSAAHVMYSSGMAAIQSIMFSFVGRQHGHTPPLTAVLLGSYFETRLLLERFPGIDLRLFTSQGAATAAVAEGEIDIVIVEPVFFDYTLETLDLAALEEALLRTGRPKLVLVDTTVVGHRFPVEPFLERIGGHEPAPMIAQISSMLKLDQEGLEFANAGLVTIWARERGSRFDSDRVAQVLRRDQSMMGSGLSMIDIAALDVPFFLDRKSLSRHANAVLDNNAELARRLSEHLDGIVAEVRHPTLDSNIRRDWAVAPFLTIRLAGGELFENVSLLLGVVLEATRRRQLCFRRGMSFGFRSHRYEFIVPRSPKHGERTFFKVAMGARDGPSRVGVMDLLVELAQVPDFQALKRRYPAASLPPSGLETLLAKYHEQLGRETL